MKDLEKAKQLLLREGYTCVLCRGEAVHTSDARGVKPLVTWYEDKVPLAGFSAADKVIGKATAYLYVLHGVVEIYAGVISESAYEVLTANGIAVTWGTLVPYIINRKGDGICPFEAAVANATDTADAYRIIRETMTKMNLLP